MIRLHHVNLTSLNARQMADFYQRALGLEPNEAFMKRLAVGSSADGERYGDKGDLYDLPIITLIAGDPEELHLHLSTIDNSLAKRLGKWVNPLGVQGHFAFRTDDIEAVKARLDEVGIEYDDYGSWAFQPPLKWEQIFFADPMGNIVEVHQVVSS